MLVKPNYLDLHGNLFQSRGLAIFASKTSIYSLLINHHCYHVLHDCLREALFL